jgi:hypothetical protein
MLENAGLVIFFPKRHDTKCKISWLKTYEFLPSKGFMFQMWSVGSARIFTALGLFVFKHDNFCEKSWTCDFFKNLKIYEEAFFICFSFNNAPFGPGSKLGA